MMAPAVFNRRTAIASFSAVAPVPGVPQVVGRPATLNDSLTVMGTPSKARRSPRASSASAAVAAARARSKSRTMTAFSLPSRASIRRIEWLRASVAEMRPECSASTRAVVVRKSIGRILAQPDRRPKSRHDGDRIETGDAHRGGREGTAQSWRQRSRIRIDEEGADRGREVDGCWRARNDTQIARIADEQKSAARLDLHHAGARVGSGGIDPDESERGNP